MKLKFLLIILFSTCLSATDFYFHYDGAGNRDGRRIILFLKKGLPDKEYKDSILNCVVTVTPNPTKGWLEVTISDPPKDSKTSLVVYGLEGKPMIEKENFGDAYKIDLSGKPNGVYIIRIVIDGKPLDYKIIKQE